VRIAAVLIGAILGCSSGRIAPGGPKPGAPGFRRVMIHNGSDRAICSITACFQHAYRVAPKSGAPLSPRAPLRPNERVQMDVPACGDELQADRCDHMGYIPVPLPADAEKGEIIVIHD
jgi:hypothetical protein